MAMMWMMTTMTTLMMVMMMEVVMTVVMMIRTMASMMIPITTIMGMVLHCNAARLNASFGFYLG